MQTKVKIGIINIDLDEPKYDDSTFILSEDKKALNKPKTARKPKNSNALF